MALNQCAVDERRLEIEGRFIAGNPILPAAFERHADVLVFVFDRTRAAG
jgi:hypothetical protein